ncbi:subtilisin-like protease SBT2.5 [Miscanthus floridulus]|uniref:subtilisin-like protease SBT2.5 n=1 Tax=Miscanthus floridulus TaxID=154761 RepID=UPI00345A6BBD
MAKQQQEVYFVFMNFDPVYERLRADRSKEGSATLDAYLSQKHDKLLAKLLQPDSYRKRSSLAIVDGFAVEITEDQASVLRSAKEVRVVEKNQELA